VSPLFLNCLQLILSCYIEIYGALCYATLLVKRAAAVEAEHYKKRRHLLYFQCVTESSFDSVTMSEFREIKGVIRGDRLQAAAPAVNTLAMMGDIPPPPPPH
jgi:hypothetical protein